MLTLTRKVGQKIRIGDHIELVVREIRGRQVRLGISAPQGLPVYREELYQQIAQEGAHPKEPVAEAAAEPAADPGDDGTPGAAR
jgi:carbon storage regulator